MKNALVVGEKALAKNLVSIPSLDRAGYTTTFANGEGVVTDPHGNVIARAPLQNSNLYEFDIRQLFEQVESALLGSVLLDEKEINTWHLRLGHRNEDDLRFAIKKNLIAGVPTAAAKKQKSRSLCDACVRAKSHRHPRRIKRKKNKKFFTSAVRFT